MVHNISIGVLWVVEDGVGLAFRLYRIKTQTRSALTNIDIRVIMTKRTLSSHCISLANSVTGGWKFIPFGIGFPITGKFLSKPSLANSVEADAVKKTVPKAAINMLKRHRKKLFIKPPKHSFKLQLLDQYIYSLHFVKIYYKTNQNILKRLKIFAFYFKHYFRLNRRNKFNVYQIF